MADHDAAGTGQQDKTVILPARGLGVFAVGIARYTQLRPITYLLIFLAMTVVIDLLDSFGIEERQDEAAAHALGALWSPLYGGGEREGQARITVVPIRQEFLDQHDVDFWPLPYHDQIKLVREIANYVPAAIFLDLYYTRPQGEVGGQAFAAMFGQTTPVDGFADALAELALEVPIFIGPVGDHQALNRLAAAFPPGAGQVGITLVDNPAFDYPLRDPEHLDAQGNFVPLDQARLQAAPALYAVLCESDDPPRSCAEGPVHLTQTNLALQWGYGTSGNMQMLQPARQRGQCGGVDLLDRIGRVLMLGWRQAIAAAGEAADPHGAERAEVLDCMYHDTVPAHLIIDPPVADAITSVEDERIPLDDLLRGRVVMIGADLPYLADYFETPLYGDAPGVAVHAMALDNLIEQGANHQRFPKSALWGIDKADLLELIALFFTVGAIWWIYNPDPARANREESHWGASLLVIGGAALAAALVGIAMRWPPVNLLYLLFAAVGATAYIDAVRPGADAALRPAQPPANPDEET